MPEFRDIIAPMALAPDGAKTEVTEGKRRQAVHQLHDQMRDGTVFTVGHVHQLRLRRVLPTDLHLMCGESTVPGKPKTKRNLVFDKLQSDATQFPYITVTGHLKPVWQGDGVRLSKGPWSDGVAPWGGPKKGDPRFLFQIAHGTYVMVVDVDADSEARAAFDAQN